MANFTDFNKWGSDKELDEIIYFGSAMERAHLADQRYGLDILVHDRDPYVRCRVAMQGYGLDLLVKDKAPAVAFMACQEVRKEGFIFIDDWKKSRKNFLSTQTKKKSYATAQRDAVKDNKRAAGEDNHTKKENIKQEGR